MRSALSDELHPEPMRSALSDELHPETIQINFRPAVPVLEEVEELHPQARVGSPANRLGPLVQPLETEEAGELHLQARAGSPADRLNQYRQPVP
jgi:hypothetical protein